MSSHPDGRWLAMTLHDHDTLGRFLRERRLDRKGTPRFKGQEDIAKETGWSQTQISKIERGSVDMSDWRPEGIYDLFLAYDLTPSEMIEVAKRYELDAFEAYVTDRSQLYGVSAGAARVKHVGTIGAGRLGVSFADDEVTYRTCPQPIAAKYRVEDIISATVDGDSMVSDDARDTIPPGSVVYLHTKLAPEEGEIVCAYLRSKDHSVLKRYNERDGYTVLRSSNIHHEPIVIRENDEAIIQGVYLMHESIGPRVK
jgi:phage repressor protein C with HTH and peptisase S24 domain